MISRSFAAFVHILASFALFTLLPADAGAQDRLTLLLTGDLDRMQEQDGRGGLARLAAAVEAEREARENVLFLHAGDAISPSLMSGFDQGAHMIALLNRIGPDLFVPGNHEFDFGVEVFEARIAEAGFPVIATNVRKDGSPLDGALTAYAIGIGDAVIGFIGITSPTAAMRASPGEGVTFLNIAETVERSAEALRDDGADLVVVLGHMHFGEDQALIRAGAADIVLSGDDHHVLAFHDGETVLGESGQQAETVLAIDLTIEKGEGRRGPFFRWRPHFRFIDTATVIPDREMEAAILEYERKLAGELDQEIGRLTTPMTSRNAVVRARESAIGNLIADAMRWATGADVALTNGGGIRANRDYEAGAMLTRRDILAELPFGNKTVVLEITGAQLMDVLRWGFISAGRGGFPQVSNMEAVIAVGGGPVPTLTSVTIDGTPLDPGRVYVLATNDFLANGGDGYAMLEGIPLIIDETDARLMASHVIDYIVVRGEVAPEIEGRIVIR